MNKNAGFILLLSATCIMSAVSQVLLKAEAIKKHNSYLSQYLNAKVILAYIMFFGVVFVNIYILKYLPMTVLSPIAEVFPFILSILFGRIFFGERITLHKIIGSLFIIAGIIVTVISLY